jgi:hypothetical protein
LEKIMKTKTNWLGVGLVLLWCIVLNFIVYVASPSLPLYASADGIARFAGTTLSMFGISWLIA